ncbi:hypothetical protein TVAG_351450 [Trichomonas vaginalis G3]|uniref:Uncharacterized protein n=1 Tax=Trichomonas vaginalis (strain ATCC PRA-98 / G3) TaxID=412133 RepID=A2DZM9_TRIV3|nr:hypothetical protein TVAG_351450 [Trichomonas vaginalis G3]|eukprot:XP_001326320.1 hypothetical protein [Trichomonas vaginalis G3]
MFNNNNQARFSETDSNGIFRALVDDNEEELASIISKYTNENIQLCKPTDYKYPNKLFGYRVYPIHVAAFFGAEKCYNYLFNIGAEESLDICYYAAAGGEVSILHKFSDFQEIAIGWSLYNPMGVAIQYGNLDCVKYMWSKGVDFSENEGYVIDACGSGFIDVVEFIYSQCPNFARIVKAHPEALIRAVKSGSVDVVNFLIKMNVNLDKTSDAGLSALVIAARSGSLSCVKSLVEAGVLFNLSRRKYNCFVEAATQGHLDIVKYLLDKGVRIDIVTSDGYDALSCAVLMRRDSVVQYLLMKGSSKMSKKDLLPKTSPAIFDIIINHFQIKIEINSVLEDCLKEPCNFSLVNHIFEKYISFNDVPENISKKIFDTDYLHPKDGFLSKLCKTKGFISDLSCEEKTPFKYIRNKKQFNLILSCGFKLSQEIIVKNRLIEMLSGSHYLIECAIKLLEDVNDIELLDKNYIITWFINNYEPEHKEFHDIFMGRFKNHLKGIKYRVSKGVFSTNLNTANRNKQVTYI